MKDYIYSSNSQVTLYLGNALDVLKTLPDESINCVVTSPPYYGLRDYNTSIWHGGNLECDHQSNDVKRGKNSVKQNTQNNGLGAGFYDVCPKCGATKEDKQIGLEKTPFEYIDKLVEIFAEVKRVLTPDGTVWLNLADSYAGSRSDKYSSVNKDSMSYRNGHRKAGVEKSIKNKLEGFKPKDLIGIPFRVAFALQDQGWYLRSDIIWEKNNPMPESVRDRPTKSHEYIFLLTKSAKYYYDADAIKEPSIEGQSITTRKNAGPGKEKKPYSVIEPEFRKEIIEYRDLPEQNEIKEYLSKWRNKRKITIQQIEDYFKSQAPHHWFETNGSYPSVSDWKELKMLLGFDDIFDSRMTNIYEKSGMKQTYEYRNKRDVWHMNTSSFPGSHFAVFPNELPTTCIKAGTKPGGVVLDPFAGSGTTLEVANSLGRKAIGIDLNPQFLDMCLTRTQQMSLFISS